MFSLLEIAPVQPLVDSNLEEVISMDSNSNPSCRVRLLDSKFLFFIVLALTLRQIVFKYLIMRFDFLFQNFKYFNFLFNYEF